MMNGNVICNHRYSNKISNYFVDKEIYSVINGVLFCRLGSCIVPYSTIVKYGSIDDINNDMKLLGVDTRFSLVE